MFNPSKIDVVLYAELHKLSLVSKSVAPDFSVDIVGPELVTVHLADDRLFPDSILTKLVKLETALILVDQHLHRPQVIGKIVSIIVTIIGNAIVRV